MAGATKITERGTDGVAFEANTPSSQPGDTFPAGTTVMWPGAVAPAGWMICDGSAISRAGFPTLFANISTTWGAGDGSTTFNIPDFRDRAPVGASAGKALGSGAGAETNNLSTAQMPTHSHGGFTGAQNVNHTHTWDEGLNIFAIPDASSGTASIRLWGTAGATVYEGRSTGTTSTESTTHGHAIPAEGSGAAFSIMQPYRAINYIIRAY